MQETTRLRPLCMQQTCPDPIRYILVSNANGSVSALSLDGICASSKQVKEAWVQSDGSWLVLTQSNTLYATWNSQSIWQESSESRDCEQISAKRSRSEPVRKIQQWTEPIACCFVKDDPEGIIIASESAIQMVRTDSVSNIPCSMPLLSNTNPVSALWLGQSKSAVLLGMSNGDIVESSSGKTAASLDGKVSLLFQISSKVAIAIATCGSGCLIHLGSNIRTTNFALECPILDAFLLREQLLVCITSLGFLISLRLIVKENGEIDLSTPQKILVSNGRIMRAFQISPNSICLVFGDEETWCAYEVSIDHSIGSIDASTNQDSLSTLIEKLEQQYESHDELVEDKEDCYLTERIANASLAIGLKNEKIKCCVCIVRLGCDLRLRIRVEDTTKNDFGLNQIPMNLIVHLQQGPIQEIVCESIVGKQEIEVVPSPSFFSNCYNRLLPLIVKVTSHVVFESGSGISKVIATSRFDAFDLGEFNNPSRPFSQKPHQAYPIIRAKRSALLNKIAYVESHVAGSILRAILPSHSVITDHSSFKASSHSPEMRILLDVDGDKIDLQLMANDVLVAAVARSALLSRFAELLKEEMMLPRFGLSAKRSVAHLHSMCESLEQQRTHDTASQSKFQHSVAMNTVDVWQAIRTSSYNHSNNVQI